MGGPGNPTTRKDDERGLRLVDGSRVVVIGGGPAGSFFSYFLLTMAERASMNLAVDVYEPKSYTVPGPAGCNMCGGIVSESMVQLLAAEGINLPPTVVQRGIDSYVLHMDVGTVRIATPRQEKRIAAVHRGAGPRGIEERRWGSFDGHLLDMAARRGARVVRERVEEVTWDAGRPRVRTKSGTSDPYDLLVGAIGVNTSGLRLFEISGNGYVPPGTTKTAICEFFLGEETIGYYLGSAMHVFLLNVPNLEFAAIIPKGEYATVCLLGKDIDREMVKAFLSHRSVRECFPPDWEVPEDFCRCFPSINVSGAGHPFSNRMVVIGDSGVSRLYKDGIGGAYRTAKAAAKTAVFEGISAEAFERHFLPTCQSLDRDNAIGKLIFRVTTLIQNARFLRRGVLKMVAREQDKGLGPRRMSAVLWDTFTGSAPYRHVFLRSLHPLFLGRFLADTATGFIPYKVREWSGEGKVRTGDLGKVYRSGEPIVRQGDEGDCMYVVQSGTVEVVKESGGSEMRLAELGEGEFFGEMALFEKDVRSATVRAIGDVRVLTIDKKMILRKIHDDPSLAFRIMQKMSRRIRELNDEMMRVRSE